MDSSSNGRPSNLFDIPEKRNARVAKPYTVVYVVDAISSKRGYINYPD